MALLAASGLGGCESRGTPDDPGRHASDRPSAASKQPGPSGEAELPETTTGVGTNRGGTRRLAGLDDLGRRLHAEVGGTLGPPGQAAIAAGGQLTSGPAWSTIKVPIALRVIGDAGGLSGLTSAERDLIDRAITQSDNTAAAELFGQLERSHGGLEGAAQAVTEVLRDGRDQTTSVSTEGRDGFSPYGQTRWSLEDQHRFMAALATGCLAPPSATRYILGLMGGVTSDRWGLGSAGVEARWKGGWGPDPQGRYLLRQMGVMTIHGRQTIVTVAVRPDDGSFDSGQAAATQVARWLAQRAPRFGAPLEPCG
jgi:hypothetical protein